MFNPRFRSLNPRFNAIPVNPGILLVLPELVVERKAEAQ